MKNLLQIQDLRITAEKGNVSKPIVNNLSFNVKAGEITCLMGESGSGKSMTALAILGMLSGNLKLDPRSKIDFQGASIFCIFQEPMNSFNFSVKVKTQMYQMVKYYRNSLRSEFEEEIQEIMIRLNFENPQKILEQYPFELSGGMLQRLMVACAIYARPSLILADEPTTALDVTAQNQLLDEFYRIKTEMGIAVLLITHDFGVAAELADTIIVMHKGEIVESGTVWDIFDHPKMEYTRRLIKASAKELEEC